MDLGDQGKLVNTEGPGGGQGVEREIDGGGAMGVAAASFAAIRAGLVLRRHGKHLPTVKELRSSRNPS